MMKNFLFIILSVVALTGCAAGTSLNDHNRSQIEAQIRNRTMVVETPEAAGFQATSAGAVVGTGLVFVPGVNALAAAAVAYQKGSDIISNNHIEDPAQIISHQISSRLAKRYNLKTVSRGAADASQLAFSVQTTYWQTIYFLSDMNNYRTTIGFSAKLYDKKTGRSILEGGCVYRPEYKDTDEAPTWDGLFGNGASGFKAEIKKAQSQCVNELAEKVFGL